MLPEGRTEKSVSTFGEHFCGWKEPEQQQVLRRPCLKGPEGNRQTHDTSGSRQRGAVRRVAQAPRTLLLLGPCFRAKGLGRSWGIRLNGAGTPGAELSSRPFKEWEEEASHLRRHFGSPRTRHSSAGPNLHGSKPECSFTSLPHLRRGTTSSTGCPCRTGVAFSKTGPQLPGEGRGQARPLPRRPQFPVPQFHVQRRARCAGAGPQ